VSETGTYNATITRTDRKGNLPMSWRLIFVVLLLAAGASAWGGLQLGDWLIAHGPAQIQAPAPTQPELTSTPVLDANGKPFIASAPQPLPDGSLGVPQLAPPVDWQIQPESLLSENRPIPLATTTISMDEAIALAQRQLDGGGSASGIGSVGPNVIQPIDVTAQPTTKPAATNAPAAPTSGKWQAEFQAELKVCESLGFFSRPSCAWAARNKYCEAHQAWGKVSDCPAKKTSF
jgi:hypothetical protein